MSINELYVFGEALLGGFGKHSPTGHSHRLIFSWFWFGNDDEQASRKIWKRIGDLVGQMWLR